MVLDPDKGDGNQLLRQAIPHCHRWKTFHLKVRERLQVGNNTTAMDDVVRVHGYMFGVYGLMMGLRGYAGVPHVELALEYPLHQYSRVPRLHYVGCAKNELFWLPRSDTFGGCAGKHIPDALYDLKDPYKIS